MVDKLDTEIARYLIDNSKLSIRDLAKLCNVSPGTIRNHLQKMETDKQIIAYTTRLQGKRLGLEEAILGLDIMPEHYTRTLEELRKLTFIKSLFSTSGDHSAIAIVISKLYGKSMNECIAEIEATEGVRNVYPSIVNSTLK
ncbi:Lrp/AsnC family transcriptional regulator [Ferroplasma acidiphilum]|jgi:Lrp/AsnC family transcriptional regulator for asnA, asnC and gidA|uniref:AsnC family transcriptional regulator n=1 Tax=Ferroplasma acidiphilum TaxID=74969 RepID=A0A1V0N602_9ARCH|nr:Lrp/AsnC family transcriptional regulator [Ferroplasma acidiphilum]ARD85541.1 AsnC family transcriptional regulator [Ferroplasma acidiphilum]MCL4348693.1 Lrp/AsnC family transcriptional regulator [Candidatus Thermoplasmatota archaeon]WMT52675.1 MAG: Lrp/AsnC family transcriptional regulator [Ferroplasma acidiphilum]